MFKNSVFLIAVMAFCGIAFADITAPGACPSDIRVMPNYDAAKYLGLWYEYARYPYFFENDGVCNTATYSLESDGNVLVNNTMLNTKTKKLEGIIGHAVLVENAKLKISIKVNPFFTASANYWILDTDYTTYSCVYACEPFPATMHTTYLWILTREKFASENAIAKCKEVFLRNDISLEPLQQNIQEDC